MPPRIHVPEPLRPGAELALPAGAARHVQVLRLQPGDALTLFDGAGGEWTASVTHMGRSEVRVRPAAHAAVEREAARAVHLAAGLMVTGSVPVGSGEALTAGTLVAFTTLQARLLMPMMSLMRVSLDVQTSVALFRRIFEYLDLQPAITDKPGAVLSTAIRRPSSMSQFATKVRRAL